MSSDPLWGDRPAGYRLGLIGFGALMTATLAVISVAGLMVALYAVLVTRMTPAEAALLVAGVAAVTTIVAASLTALAARRARRIFRNTLAVRTATLLAPPALSLATRHLGIAGVVAAAVAAYLVTRRR